MPPPPPTSHVGLWAWMLLSVFSVFYWFLLSAAGDVAARLSCRFMIIFKKKIGGRRDGGRNHSTPPPPCTPTWTEKRD